MNDNTIKTPTLDQLSSDGRLLYAHPNTAIANDYARLLQNRLTEAGVDTYAYFGNLHTYLFLMHGLNNNNRAAIVDALGDELFTLNHPELPEQEAGQ